MKTALNITAETSGQVIRKFTDIEFICYFNCRKPYIAVFVFIICNIKLKTRSNGISVSVFNLYRVAPAETYISCIAILVYIVYNSENLSENVIFRNCWLPSLNTLILCLLGATVFFLRSVPQLFILLFWVVLFPLQWRYPTKGLHYILDS